LKNPHANTSHFDYIIIGGGAAGLHLAMAMAHDNYFSNKRVAIFDKTTKSGNDKTYCFWEKTTGKWNDCVSKTWRHAYFKDKKRTQSLNLKPYIYKKINAFDFYTFCKTTLTKKSTTFHFFTEEILDVSEENTKVIVKTKNKEYNCSHAFDSRIEVSLNTIKKKSTYINQSFKGWLIETKIPAFAPERFTMMDYSIQWNESTSFMYILPVSRTEALLEYTLFTPETITDKDFDKQLKKYINDYLPNIEYHIKATEKGSIPMTNYAFNKHHTKRITKIGTAGGWVKASTGYSFKFAEKNALTIVTQLKQNKHPIGHKSSWRFQFYDKLFLKILAHENTKGAELFAEMYEKTEPSLLLKFMDEETSVFEEFEFIKELTPWPFLKAIFRK